MNYKFPLALNSVASQEATYTSDGARIEPRFSLSGEEEGKKDAREKQRGDYEIDIIFSLMYS